MQIQFIGYVKRYCQIIVSLFILKEEINFDYFLAVQSIHKGVQLLRQILSLIR